MESIKREECEVFQQLSAQYLVKLLDLVAHRNPSPNNKIITNLCTLLKSDIDFTPKIVSFLPNEFYSRVGIPYRCRNTFFFYLKFPLRP